jgi:hypothetical protein
MIAQTRNRIVAATTGILLVAAALADEKQENAKPELIEVTGKILGVGIGTPMKEARENLGALQTERENPKQTAPEKDRSDEGEREIWRPDETEYQWIVAWAKQGKIVKLSASLRSDQRKPFEEIGDLRRAAVNTENVAMWNVTRPSGGNFRLVAKGPDRHAASIYMLSLQHAIDE